MKFKYLTAGALIGASVLLAACGPSNKNNDNNGGNAGASLKADNSPVVATVNGKAIHESAVDALLSSIAGGRNINPPPQARRRLLDRLVQLKALADKAQKDGLADNADVQAEIRIQRQALLAKALVSQYMDQHPVTDEQVQAAYKKQTQAMDKTEYKARHILVNDEKTAEKVIDKLNNGANFTKLAKKMSTGPSAKNGGELGWFSPSDMVPPFAAAVEKLKKGEYTKQPVKTQFGWHVILLEDTRPVPQPKLADVQASIKQKLQSQEVQDFVNSVQKQAKIDINESAFAPKTPAPASTAPATHAPAPASTSQPKAASK
ncbi:MAG TPA: peptidylprolyl isomerase [Gammaproteobacteria bacterium]|nr:peptidylprolyl isomerase [Gammaproteobacteria bacterium]